MFLQMLRQQYQHKVFLPTELQVVTAELLQQVLVLLLLAVMAELQFYRHQLPTNNAAAAVAELLVQMALVEMADQLRLRLQPRQTAAEAEAVAQMVRFLVVDQPLAELL